MESSNIYIIIIVMAILFLLLDYVITNIHFNIENFHNPEIAPTESNMEINDISPASNGRFCPMVSAQITMCPS